MMVIIIGINGGEEPIGVVAALVHADGTFEIDALNKDDECISAEMIFIQAS